MKRKSGFTLIELLVTIALMVLVGLLVANNMASIFSKREDSNVEDFESLLEDAACTYIELSSPIIKSKKAQCKSSGNCTVLVGELIDNGLVEDDSINPVTKSVISRTDVVKIVYDQGEKKCEFDAYHVG